MSRVKKSSILFAALLFACTVSLYLYADARVIENTAIANHKIYNDFDKLEEAVDLIVLAKATGTRDNNVIGDDPMTRHGYTLTEISIEKVYQNKRGTKLIAGDNLKISEPYYVYDRGVYPGKIKNIYSGYSEIQDDSYYILYLNWYEGSNSYSVHSLNQGKYNLDGLDLKENVAIKDSTAKNLKEEVLRKYSNDLTAVNKDS